MSSCSAASRREAPPSTRAITRMRMSAEYAFGMVRPPDESMPPDSPTYRSLGTLRFYSARTCSRFERIDDGARQGSDAQQRLRTARLGSATASGGHLEMFLSERNFRPMVRREFLDQSRVPRCVTAASALPSDLHRQL